jgi:hypothetical protein
MVDLGLFEDERVGDYDDAHPSSAWSIVEVATSLAKDLRGRGVEANGLTPPARISWARPRD